MFYVYFVATVHAAVVALFAFCNPPVCIKGISLLHFVTTVQVVVLFAFFLTP